MLFQVHFLSLLLEERGAGSLAEVAEHCRQKLIRRHPHVFGDVEVETRAARCCATGTRSSATEAGREPGIFGEVPENLPGPLYARKVQRRAASTGFDFEHVPYDAVEGELEELRAAEGDREAALPRGRRRAVRGGQRRAQAQGRPGARAARGVASASAAACETAADLAARAGADWNDLGPNAQLGYYAQARLAEHQGDTE